MLRGSFGIEHLQSEASSRTPAQCSTGRWLTKQRELQKFLALPVVRGAACPRTRTVAGTLPWQTSQRPSKDPVQPGRHVEKPHAPIPNTKDLVGFNVVVVKKLTGGRKRIKEDLIGVVTDVLAVADTGAAHPLLRVVGEATKVKKAVKSRTLQDNFLPQAEHLIPLVRTIIPVIDHAAGRVIIDPPGGLLELGHRRALLHHLRSELASLVKPSTSGMGAPMMPTRRELLSVGRADLVRLIAAAGGFLDVAQSLGYRSVRRPPGYWEDEAALDRELSLFVAAHWVRFGAQSDDENGQADEGGDSTVGKETVVRDTVNPEEQRCLEYMPGDTRQDDKRHDDTAKAAASGHDDESFYWYNQVTRRVRWTEPVLPEALPLDDEGSVLFTDSYDDRAMPSRGSILAAGRYDLHAAIMAAGGYTAVAEELDRWAAWPPTRHLRSGKTFATELKRFCIEEGLPRRTMPTPTELQSLGRTDLHQAVLRHGGYSAVAEKLRWKPHRRPRGAWKDIESAAMEVARFAEAAASQSGHEPRMPTHEELRAAGRHDLRHVLQMHGSEKVAEAAGLPPLKRPGGRKGRPERGMLEAMFANESEDLVEDVRD